MFAVGDLIVFSIDGSLLRDDPDQINDNFSIFPLRLIKAGTMGTVLKLGQRRLTAYVMADAAMGWVPLGLLKKVL